MNCCGHRGKFLAVIVGVGLIAGLVVKTLWNWLLPALFGFPAVSFLQAVGLLVLTKILFGGFHRHAGAHWRRRMTERWEEMSPEEREKFKSGLESCCGLFGRSDKMPDEKENK